MGLFITVAEVAEEVEDVDEEDLHVAPVESEEQDLIGGITG